MQSLCTLRTHCRQWLRNTRYQAGATPYLGRTFTGWIAPASPGALLLLHRSGLSPHTPCRSPGALTHATARRIAQPPTATFVTRLRPFRLPGRAARQLPDQSTILWVASSSTGDSRLRGALPRVDVHPAFPHTAAIGTSRLSRPPWRSPKFQKLRRASNSSRRQWVIQDPQLREHRGLIPIEMLIGHFAGLKLDDAHQGELDPSTRGWHAGKHPTHLESMRKPNNELFDDPIVAEGLR